MLILNVLVMRAAVQESQSSSGAAESQKLHREGFETLAMILQLFREKMS